MIDAENIVTFSNVEILAIKSDKKYLIDFLQLPT